jgi:hypothetical protein
LGEGYASADTSLSPRNTPHPAAALIGWINSIVLPAGMSDIERRLL